MRLEENHDLYHHSLLTYFLSTELERAVRQVVGFGLREVAHLGMLDGGTPLLACLNAFYGHHLRLIQGEP